MGKNSRSQNPVNGPASGSATLQVWLKPGGKKNRLVGFHGQAVKIEVQAPAREERANQALIVFLAENLHVRRNQITIVQGEHSRLKVLELQGTDPAALQAWIDRSNP